MTIEAEARLTMNTGEVRTITFDMPLPYKMGACSLAIARAGIDKRDVREARITY
jgi:hypothetical protein